MHLNSIILSFHKLSDELVHTEAWWYNLNQAYLTLKSKRIMPNLMLEFIKGGISETTWKICMRLVSKEASRLLW